MQKSRKMTGKQARARGEKIWATRREHEKNRGVCKTWLDRAEERLLSDDSRTNRHGFIALNMAMLTFLQFSEKDALSLLVNSGYLQDPEKHRRLNTEAMLFLLKVEPFSKVLDKWWDAEELAKERASLSPEEISVAKCLSEIPE